MRLPRIAQRRVGGEEVELRAEVSLPGGIEVGEHPPAAPLLEEHRVDCGDVVHYRLHELPLVGEFDGMIDPDLTRGAAFRAQIDRSVELEHEREREVKGLDQDSFGVGAVLPLDLHCRDPADSLAVSKVLYQAVGLALML